MLMCRVLKDLKDPTEQDLKQFDSDMLKSCQRVLDLPQNDYVAMLEMEDISPDLPKSKYLDNVARRVLREDVRWQMNALRRGFHNAFRDEIFFSLEWRESDLVQLFAGKSCTEHVSIRTTFRVVEDDELKQCKTFRELFWKVVDEFDEDTKRKFLKFTTGSDCLPERGSEIFTIEMPFMAFDIDEHQKILYTLPRAHTCTNTLELPNYYESLRAVRKCDDVDEECHKILKEKIEIAIHYTEGYGLDALE
jgi:hypothetical protein